VFDVFVFSSTCNSFLLFGAVLFPLVAFVSFRDLGYKNSWKNHYHYFTLPNILDHNRSPFRYLSECVVCAVRSRRAFACVGATMRVITRMSSTCVSPRHKTHFKSATTGVHLQFVLITQAIHVWSGALAKHFFLLKELRE